VVLVYVNMYSLSIAEATPQSEVCGEVNTLAACCTPMPARPITLHTPTDYSAHSFDILLIYIYIYIHTYTYIHTYIHTYIYTYIYTSSTRTPARPITLHTNAPLTYYLYYVCVCVCVRVWVWVWVWVCSLQKPR
jgi:hypothetical protein